MDSLSDKERNAALVDLRNDTPVLEQLTTLEAKREITRLPLETLEFTLDKTREQLAGRTGK